MFFEESIGGFDKRDFLYACFGCLCPADAYNDCSMDILNGHTNYCN